MDKQIVIYLYNAILLSSKNKSAIFHSVRKQINDCLGLGLCGVRKRQEGGILKEPEEPLDVREIFNILIEKMYTCVNFNQLNNLNM